MAAPLMALPWLIRAAPRFWPWLTRGKGVNIPLGGRMGIPRATGTPGTPGTVGVMGPGTRPIQGIGNLRTPRTVQDIGSVGLRSESLAHPIGGAGTASVRSIPGLKAGYARRHPLTTAAVGSTVAGTGYGLMAGGEEPIAPQVVDPYVAQDPWSAPPDILNFAEQQEALAAEGKANLSKMLKYGFGLAAAGAKTDKFFDRGMAILEQSKAYNESKHFADVVRAVYKEGDMPKNAREAYERLVPLVGPEQAVALSGHQLGMEKGKTKEERIWNDILETAQYGDLDGAAAKLVAAWSTGRLRNAPLQTNYDMRLAKAKQIISGAMSGPQFAEGVQNLEVVDA
jgi:hypothetical protein